MANDRFKRPTAPMPDQGDIFSIDSEDDFPCKIALQRQLELGAICIIKMLMPEPFAFGFFDAFANRDRAMPECREFPGQMTGQKCRQDIRGLAEWQFGPETGR